VALAVNIANEMANFGYRFGYKEEAAGSTSNLWATLALAKAAPKTTPLF
jgi:hypothetical protein